MWMRSPVPYTPSAVCEDSPVTVGVVVSTLAATTPT